MAKDKAAIFTGKDPFLGKPGKFHGGGWLPKPPKALKGMAYAPPPGKPKITYIATDKAMDPEKYAEIAASYKKYQAAVAALIGESKPEELTPEEQADLETLMEQESALWA